MNDLVKQVIEAHGGFEVWDNATEITATFQPGGAALAMRGQAMFADGPVRMTVHTKKQLTVFDPFMGYGRYGVFEPQRTTVEGIIGATIEELKNPRDSFKPDTKKWTDTQLAYFAGSAMWTYFNLPFLLATDGFKVEEGKAYAEGGETWRTLKVTFPASITTHCTEQTLYIDKKGLIRRHDYDVDISGGAKATHYLYDHQKFDGIVFATKRRIHPRGEDLTANKDAVIFSADLSDFAVSDAKASPRQFFKAAV